jgi:hypothetical protein
MQSLTQDHNAASTPTGSESKKMSRGKLSTKLALIVLVAVVPFILLEIGARLLVSIGHPSIFCTQDFDRKYELAKSPPLQKDASHILILGTSRSERGIYAEQLSSLLRERGLNADVVNLACYGATAQDEAFLADTAFSAGLKPALVVFDVGPEDLIIRHSQDGTILNQSPGAASIIDKPNGALGRLRQAFCCNLCSVTYRHYLKEIVCTSLSRVVNPISHEYDMGRGETLEAGSPQGWSPGYRTLPNTDKEEQAKAFLANTPLVPAADVVASIDAANITPIKDLCRIHHLPLVLVWLPRLSFLTDGLDRYLSGTGNTAASLMRSLAENKSYLFVDLGQDDSLLHYCDLDHLNVTGAVSATHKLCDAFSLPPYKSLLQARDKQL